MFSASLKSRFSSPSGKALVIPWLYLIVLIVGFLFAWYMGRLAGNADLKKIAGIITVIVAIIVCLTLKSKIWLLIPATWYLGGALGGVPLPFGLNELCVMFVFGMFMVFYALKIPLYKPTYEKLDVFMFVNLIYLIIVFIRNPVGVEALGADRVGGRPYFTVIISVVTYWIFRHVLLDTKLMRVFPILLGFGNLISSLLGAITRYIPGSASVILPFYTGVNTGSVIRENFNVADVSTERAVERWSEAGNLGTFLNGYLCAMYRPLTLLVPARFIQWLIFCFAWGGILMSGFRSSIINNAFIFILASYFYGGSRDVVRACGIGLAMVSFMLVGQGTLFNLPMAAQRGLSFLPANWTSQVAMDDASGSAEWRFAMWKKVWNSDRYIKNKIFGDGFGFSAADYKIQLGFMLGGGGYQGDDGTETQAITGAYHSGPLSAIRVVGIVGLILYTVLMVMAAKYAWKLILIGKQTPFFGLTLFVGLPVIYKPFDYWLIFGAFDANFPYTIFQIGLMRLVADSMDHYLHPRSEKVKLLDNSMIRGRHQPSSKSAPLAARNVAS